MLTHRMKDLLIHSFHFLVFPLSYFFFKICIVFLKHPTQVVHERRNQQERNHFIVMDDQKVFVYTMSG